MRDIFYGYYPPKDSDFRLLWKDGLIVLDTNVLLNLYRLPATARSDFLRILNEFSTRLWIPHQVALEFQRKRLSVIASERKATEEILKKAQLSIQEVQRSVEELQLDKRELDVDVVSVINSLEDAKDMLLTALKSAHEAQLDISASDPIRDDLDGLLQDRVGPGPANQVTLDELYAEGQTRYEQKIPPGFLDADKDKNPAEAWFVYRRIKHQKKYGDFILWKQTIDYVRENEVENVIFVTADKKEDWWWKEHGKTVGPHPELIQEIRDGTSVKIFWLYSPDQFLDHAKKFAAAQVSEKSVEEIKNVSVFSDFFDRKASIETSDSLALKQQYPQFNPVNTAPNHSEVLQVIDWLKLLGYSDVRAVRSMVPNIVGTIDGAIEGFLVHCFTSTNVDFEILTVGAAEVRVQSLVRKGDLDFYNAIILLPEDELENNNATYFVERFLNGTLFRGILKGAKSIIFGALGGQGFRMITEIRN